MAQDLSQFTDMWMANPWMFDPSQKSNQFSNYNNAPLPWPPTYNTGAGGPVNAATGQPIASFQQWQQQNPGGMSINATPAAPAAPQAPAPGQPMQSPIRTALPVMSQTGGPGGTMAPNWEPSNYVATGQNYTIMPRQQQQTPQAAAPQASGPPNNWMAALNSLANPGNPVTQGANVPQVQGYQPAGGINQAFLQQAGAGQGMNTNFLGALRALQNRPQQ